MVKCLYKTNTKTGKAAGENSYILVPDSHLAESVIVENAEKLAPYVAAFLQGVEDGIVKEHHKNGGKGFSDSFLSLDKILAVLDAQGQGNRLNKEKIEAWFNSEMLEALTVAFADKMGVSDTPTDAEMEKIRNVTDVYKGKYASLASGKTHYKKEEVEMLQKALEVTDAVATPIGERFYGRLEGMLSATVNDVMMGL